MLVSFLYRKTPDGLNIMETNYLILGSGLAGLSFAALMAQSGKKVVVIEAHDNAGGYAHTFSQGKDYKFNAQLHYVWNCGEGQVIHQILKKLKLDQQISFESYDRDGYDHMRMPGYALEIPCDLDLLSQRLQKLFPQHSESLKNFISFVQYISIRLEKIPPHASPAFFLTNPLLSFDLIKYQNASLQNVFDEFNLPQEAQTLLALQWPDFMLPPRDLSFFAWVVLFSGYGKGAYYPTHHFNHVVKSLVETIKNNGGVILLNSKVIQFIRDQNRILGVLVENLNNGLISEHFGDDVICNMDPQMAARMIGLEHFSNCVQKKLEYEYSPSSFMAYCVVKDLDLRNYGFGKWNRFHTEQENLNQVFDDMYIRGDYSKPSFVMTTPSLFSSEPRHCPEGTQILEILTVANYEKFRELKMSNPTKYREKKAEILDSLLNIIERDYVTNIRQHIVFKTTGSPTTNQRFCGSPFGNSYGANLTPHQVGLNHLGFNTSLDHFYFCNATSGSPGFVGTLKTGSYLYEELSRDFFLSQKPSTNSIC
jgi:phytoene dehydrogenase-like protein